MLPGYSTLLGAALLVLARRPAGVLRALLAQAAVTAALFAPFVLAGEFRMFEHHWVVDPGTLLGLALAPGMPFTWPMRLAQGGLALAAGAAVAWRLARSLHAVWATPLAVVAVRLLLDPVLNGWYWLALETVALVGAVALATTGTATAALRGARRETAIVQQR